MSVSPINSLYIHVPFCAQKCHYCAFFSEASKGEVVESYVEALIREMELTCDELRPTTIFFGGGTPSLLNLAQWKRILDAMERMGISERAREWTIECNPATVSSDKAKLLRDAGINRISMGVQSLDSGLLDRLGRVHSREMVFKSYDILRQAGFTNINLDLMFAIPFQTMEIWKSTLSEATAMAPEHLSCYEVIYEEDTVLYHQLQAGKFEVDEELACQMYDELINGVENAGYSQYEIANFARKVSDGSEDLLSCKHNVNYWEGGEFRGLGPSASEYVGGVRTKNISHTQSYCDQLRAGIRPVESVDRLSPIGRAGELAGVGLRMNRGIDFESFTRKTGFSLEEAWTAEIDQLSNLGYAEKSRGRFHLTRKGLRYADWAAELFLRS